MNAMLFQGRARILIVLFAGLLLGADRCRAPTLSYGSYLGGPKGNDVPRGIKLDQAGCMYVGLYNPVDSLPITANAAFTSGVNYVAKFDPAGTNLLYGSYVGVTGPVMDFDVDPAGNIIVVGSVGATTAFPLKNAFQTNMAPIGTAVGLLKFNPALSGSNALLYSTYLGSTASNNAVDYMGCAVAADRAGNVYVMGRTTGTNLPVRNAFQPVNRGGMDLFLAKFNTLAAGSDSLVFCTYFGGETNELSIETIPHMEADDAGRLYIYDYTESTNLPVLNAFQSTINRTVSFYNSFLARFDASGTTPVLKYSTYLPQLRMPGGLAVDNTGRAWLTGYHDASRDPFWITNAFQPRGNGTFDAYLACFDTQATGTASLVSCTLFGGSGYDIGSTVALDPASNIYLTGVTQSTNFPTLAALQPQSPSTGVTFAVFAAKFDAIASNLLYSTYLGGSGNEWLGSPVLSPYIVASGNGSATVLGFTTSTNIMIHRPYQGGQASPTNTGDAFLMKIDDPLPAVSTSALTLAVTEGQAPASKPRFEIWNAATGTVLNYTLTANRPWLTLTPASGMSTGQHHAIEAAVKSEKLLPGQYKAVISIVSPESRASPPLEFVLQVNPP